MVEACRFWSLLCGVDRGVHMASSAGRIGGARVIGSIVIDRDVSPAVLAPGPLLDDGQLDDGQAEPAHFPRNLVQGLATASAVGVVDTAPWIA